MSNLDNLSEALTAAAIGFNDGANKGFWRVQLRDGDGQWMEMGRGLMANVLMPDGSTKNLSGVYIGPSDRPGYGRMLVQNEDGSYTTYEVSSHNSRQFEAKIADEDLKRQGVENVPGDQVGDNFKLEAQKLEDMNPQPATEEDIKLATVTPDDEQKKIVEDSRANSPLAKLPAGAEKTMSPEELAKAVGGQESEVAAKDSIADAGLTPLDSNDADLQEYSNDADSKDPVAGIAKVADGYEATNYLTGEIHKAESEAEAKQWVADEYNGTNSAKKQAEDDAKQAERDAADQAEREADKATLMSKKEFINKVVEDAYSGYEQGMDKPQIPNDKALEEAYAQYEDEFKLTEQQDGQVDNDAASEIFDRAVATASEDAFGEFDEDFVKLWNDAAYGEGAKVDALGGPKKDSKKKEESAFITPADVVGSSNVYALDDIKKGDYFYDTKTADILQATEDARWNADKTAVEIPAVDASGADRSLEVTNNKAAVAKINYKSPSEKPVSEKSPAPVEDTTPSTNAPAMPDTATTVKVSEVKEGDDLFTPSGTYLGKVSKVQAGIKDAMNKSAVRLHYTDETGRDYRTVYPLDAKFNVVSAPEKTAEPETAPEAPSAPEVPATPAAPEATKPARVPADEMTMSQLIDDVKSRMDKADATAGANPDYFKEARAILDDPNLTDAEKLSQVAHALRTTPLGQGQKGAQREATRSIMNNLRTAGVHEASKEYEQQLAEEARKKYEAENKTPVAAPTVINPGQPDDGKPISPVSMSREEMYDLDVQEVLDPEGNPLPDLDGDPIYHGNAIINALMAANPEAKLTEDNGLVIERSTFTDHDGTEYNYQITVYPTFGGQIVERYTITDMAGNVVEDFQHADYKDSIKGLYGSKNGVTVFRDQLLGRAMPPGKLTRGKLSYFGTNKTLKNRMTFFRGAGSSDPSLAKVRDIDSNIKFFLEGRDTEINRVSKKARSANVRGSRLRSFIPSFYEAFDLKNTALMRERLVQLLGRLPENATSREKLIAVLKEELTNRYKGTNRASEIGLLIHGLDKWMATEGVDLRNLGKAPWVSTDGTTPVQVGDKVRAYGNENQMMVGIVTRLNKRTGGNGAYKDTIAIKFADGKVINIFAARNVEILDENHPDADVPLDNYEPWIRGDEMRRIRLGDEPAQESEFLDFGPKDPEDEDPADPNAGTPYLGSDGVSNGPSDSGTKAEDLTPGSAWHSEEGEYLGSVVEVVEVPANDGGEPGIAVVYVDADGVDQVEIVDKGTVRLPK